MEFLVYASAILNLASFISRQQVFTQPNYNIAASHNNTLWGQRSSFSPCRVSSHYVCPNFTNSLKVKKKRKRGGRIKPRPINVVSSSTSGKHHERSVNKNNLILLNNNFEKKVSKDLKIGLLNIHSVNKKENLIENIILDSELDLFFFYD